MWLRFCFFKQKTAYEMRISDWSSDVCSSDLTDQGNGGGRDSWSNDLLAPSPDAGQTGRAHRCRRRRALWSPARCGTFASPPVKWPARQGKSEDQDALEAARRLRGALRRPRSEEHTSELQSLMRISYAVFCLTKQTKK